MCHWCRATRVPAKVRRRWRSARRVHGAATTRLRPHHTGYPRASARDRGGKCARVLVYDHLFVCEDVCRVVWMASFVITVLLLVCGG